MPRPTTQTWMTALAAGGMALSATFAAPPAHAACPTSISFSSLTPSYVATCGELEFYDFQGISFARPGTVDFLTSGSTTQSLVFNFDPPGLPDSGGIPDTFAYKVRVLSFPANYLVSASPTLVGSASPTSFADLTSPQFGTAVSIYQMNAEIEVVAAPTTTQTISQLTHTYTKAFVPAPLPILGAGAAFGFTRKLRKRIKSAT